MKIAYVDGQIDELKGGNDVRGQGKGGSTQVAIARAMRAMLKESPKLKRKRFTDGMTFRGTIRVLNSVNNPSDV
jgi:hypothetical protein